MDNEAEGLVSIKMSDGGGGEYIKVSIMAAGIVA